jgi:hypothetical protein
MLTEGARKIYRGRHGARGRRVGQGCSKAKLKSSGDKASPCFKPFWIGKLSDQYLPIRTLLYVSFKQILMSLANFMGIPNSIKMLYNTSLLPES